MKIRFFAVIAILAMCSMSSFANVVLNNGQIVNVLIDDNVSSKGKGSVTGTVLTDILNNQGDVMIKGGTPVLLKVEKTPKRGIGKPGEVVVYSRNYVTNKLLQEHGIVTHIIPSSELSRGRGGPRCMSMPLVREV